MRGRIAGIGAGCALVLLLAACGHLDKTYISTLSPEPTTSPSVEPSASATSKTNPVTMSGITAWFEKPITYYKVSIRGVFLATFTWDKDDQRDCGSVGPQTTEHGTTSTWFWRHPDRSLNGDCPNESYHPGVITVQVLSERTYDYSTSQPVIWSCHASYPSGSAPGTGPTGTCVEHSAH